MKQCSFLVHEDDHTYSHYALVFAVQMDFQFDPDELRTELLRRKHNQTSVDVERLTATQFKITVSLKQGEAQATYDHFFDLLDEIEDEVRQAKHDQHMLGLLAA